MKQVFAFIKKYWWVAIIIFLLVGKKIYKWWKTKPSGTEKTEDAKKILDKLTLPDELKSRLNNIALQVAEKLGTSYSWYDPRHWTESDKEVYELLKDLNKSQFDVVADLYFKVYAKGNTLSVDLSKYLDKEFYNQLKYK